MEAPPQVIASIVYLMTALALTMLGEKARADADMQMRNVPWEEVGKIARRFVAEESPDSVWPFQRAGLKLLAASPRKVIVHYMPSHAISYDNKPIEADTWALELLQRSGERGKWANVGGWGRQRPLPAGPWTSPYWREINTAVDVFRAQLMGADAFGIDILQVGSGPLWDQTRRVCAAATALAPEFHVVPEFDSVALAKAGADDIVMALEQLAACPAIYRLPDGRILHVPFAPDTRTPEFWREVENKLAARHIAIAFVPDLLDLNRYADAFGPLSAGLTSWGARDPATINSEAWRNMQRHAAALHPQYWMVPIAPQDARPNQQLVAEAANTGLLRAEWAWVMESHPNLVQMITWNDYGEGTEFSPSSGSQFLFYDLSSYFIDWYKSGRPPPITRDAIYYSHRTQVFDPTRILTVGDLPYKFTGKTPLQNNVEMVALLTAPARLQIELNGRKVERDVSAGMQVLSMPASPGRPIFRILRNGKTVVEKVSDWMIDAHPTVSNADYFGGSSTRDFRKVPAPH